MTVRLSHRKRPPFLFSQRARVNQLVCDPRPYVRAWAEDGRPLWAPCLAWSPGPVQLASTGDGSYSTLYGENWLAQVCQDGTWRLYKRASAEVLEVVEWDVEPPTVAITARHPTLAFDQAARPAIAWEDSEGVRLREYNEVAQSYHFIGPFPGCDPVLLTDATINYRVAGSDVILFYLSADRTKLLYRIQSENFAVVHEHFDFGEAVVLDAQDVGSWRFQLKYADSAGTVQGPLADGFTALWSDLYPVYVEERMGAAVHGLEDGEYVLVVIKHSGEDGMAASVGALADGLLASVILRQSGEDALEALVGALEAGELRHVILYAAGSDDLEATVASLGDGAYVLAVIKRDPVTEQMVGVVGSLEGGAYVAA